MRKDEARGLSPEQKEETRRRAEANFARAVPRDEQRARKQRAKERKARRGGGRRRDRPRLEDEGDWDELDGFEAMGAGGARERVERGRASGPGDAVPRADVTPVRGERRGLVVGIERDGALVELVDDRATALRVPFGRGLELAVGDELRVLPLVDGLGRIIGRLPRRTELARADPAKPGARRVLAANVDVGLVVLSVVAPRFKPGLFDRFSVALAAGGIEARMVVNKLDLLEDAGELDAQLAPYARAGVRIHRVSTVTGAGLDGLRAAVRGRTLVAVGHSGVGKSSLLNALDPSGPGRATGAVRASDGKGRHTTTSSQLRRLDGDATVLIDTPGIRSLGLAAEQLAALDASYPDVAAHAARCRFSDCRHASEPDCAVRAALEAGSVDPGRVAAYLRLRDA